MLECKSSLNLNYTQGKKSRQVAVESSPNMQRAKKVGWEGHALAVSQSVELGLQYYREPKHDGFEDSIENINQS